MVLGLKPHEASTKDEPQTPPPLRAPNSEFQKVFAAPPPVAVRRPRGAPEFPAPPVLPSVGGAWVAQGPGPIRGGQTEGMSGANSPVIGAIQAIVAQPGNADVIYLGAVNGGIWKTTNGTAASPTWTPQTDSFDSLSIGAMALDPTDGTNNTIVAGLGRFSSFSSVGGPRAGLLRTANATAVTPTWTALTGGGTLTGKNISGVAPRGATIVVSINIADSFTCDNIGIFRSTNTGGSFTRISATNGTGTGLPKGRAFDLASDPSNNAVLYTAIRDADVCNVTGMNGVYKSTDTGATWIRVSDLAAMDALFANSGINNTRIAAGLSGQVFAGIIISGQLGGLFRSPTGNAGSWTQLDSPSTNEGGFIFGLQPDENPDPPGAFVPGGQGSIHFSIVADPTDANIVYVGGDRQPGGNNDTTFPNSIGANNFTGRLFRVNAAAGMGSQATPLTHCQVVNPGCNGSTSTASNSAPHADSRRMVFDANGNILEGDDGGIFRRTNPRMVGDWFSVNGSVQVTEAHDVAYDTVSNMIMTGNQDNGTSEQRTAGSTTWDAVSGGDGGDVAIDDIGSMTQSRRYSSFQNLGGFRRRTVNSSGVTTLTEFPALTVTGGGPDFVPQFVTPIEVNKVPASAMRMLFAGDNDLYESLDRGDTIAALGLNQSVDAMVYGGRSGVTDNPDVIYAISAGGANANGPNVFVRTAAATSLVQTATSPGSSILRDIAIDTTDFHKAFVVNNAGQVFQTIDTGATWTNITGNLGSGTTDLRTIVFIPGATPAIAVGGLNGVFRMAIGNPGVWNQLGTGLTNALVFDMDYDATDDTLVIGTMGRGAWKLAAVAAPPSALSIDDVTVTEGNAGTTPATFTVTLTPASSDTVTVNFASADGTATVADGDYQANSGMLTFNPGETTKPITINVNGDTKFESNENFFVNLSLPSNATISDSQGQGTINNDDAQPSMTINDVIAAEGNAGATPFVFTVTLSNASSQTITVNFATADGTATVADGDYQATSGMLTFNPGELTKQITVNVNGDTKVEPNEDFFVNLSTAANATIADSQGHGTITNDDVGPARTFVSVNGNDGNDCRNVSTPCRTFDQAIFQVAAGGEVIVLRTGSYGGATITKSVKINVPTGVIAFTAASFTINGGMSDVVVLRGLTIKALVAGTGTGIVFNTGAALYIESCVIDGWSIGVDSVSTGKVFVTNTTVRNSVNSGLRAMSSAGVSVDRSRFEGTSAGCGVEMRSNAKGTVRDSVSSGNNDGFCATAAGAVIDVQRSLASNNGSGILAFGTALARAARSTIVNNATGLNNAGSTFESLGNNLVRGNTLDTSGTITVVAGK
jgi:hypothetical protein